MKNFYRQFNLKTAVTAIAFITCFLSASSQDMLPGVVRIKVSEPLATELEHTAITTNASGEVVTGIPSLDELNRQFHVRRFSRIFPPAGRNERRHRRHGLHLWYEVNIDTDIPVTALLQSYRSENGILRAEPVYRKSIVGSHADHFGPLVMQPPGMLPAASNDPLLERQWHYQNTGQTGGTPGADIGLLDAWKVETGNKNVIIAVTDQGIQTDHEDLAANMWVNEGEISGNNVDDDNNGYVDDIHGYNFIAQQADIVAGPHGTHVAGTIAAVTNNGRGVAGVAGGSGKNDGVRLMSCAVFPDEGSGGGFAEAYVYSADNGAVISQNSWGYTYPGVFEQVVLDAIDYFIAEAGKDEHGMQTGPMNGGIMIFSAGNDNDEGHYYPAYYEPVVAVASSTHRDAKALYSNYGDWIDITAPGGETYNTDNEGVVSTLPGNQYGAFMGTSMACPHVSGVAGLILSKFARPGFRPETLRRSLLSSVDDIYDTNPSYGGKLGTGRLNAAVALSEDDQVAPGPVDDLAVAGKDVGEITLTWTSPRDAEGFAVEYDIRYATAPITGENFNTATKPPGITAPAPAGTTELFTIGNLVGGRVYYFALKSMDLYGNVSPLSNVVSETAVHTPSIVVIPTSITESLETAGQSKRTITITNEGKGSLKYALRKSTVETFYEVTPLQGTVLPGNSQDITIAFDASGLFSGSYTDDLVVQSNDPQRNSVVIPITLQVTNNGAPIASVEPTTLDFKSAQQGHSVHRTVTLSNAGSDPLVVSDITSDHPFFHADLPAPLNIAPFSDAEIRIAFSPSTTGEARGTVSIHTNDPTHPTLKVAVRGEGLQEAPLAISPNAFNETLAKGSKVTRNMALRNNGSQEISYRFEVTDARIAPSQDPAWARNSNARIASAPDSTATRMARKHLEHKARLMEKYSGAGNMVKAFPQPSGYSKGTGAAGRTSRYATGDVRQYATGFEEFSAGSVGEQNGWFTTGGYTVAEENPDKGTKHLRGTSVVAGSGEEFALSPGLYEDSEDLPRYSHTSMRLNIDEAAGATWQIVPQDPWFVATRIIFNADRTIDAMVIDNEYEVHFRRVPVTTPEGYFDLAIEYDNWGSDTSGFPTYLLFINNQHVFSGAGIGFVLGQVAFVGDMGANGPTFDVDEFRVAGGEYIPQFVKPNPAAGVIPAGQSANVALEFDASIMKYGSYESDLVVHIDETDSVMLPVALTVSGEPALRIEPFGIGMELSKGEEGTAGITLTNSGGAPVEFAFENDIEGLTLTPGKGTLALREDLIVTARFSGAPGFYNDTVRVHTNFQAESLKLPVSIVVYDSGSVFYKPQLVEFEVPQGQISARTFQIRNDGINTVSFTAHMAPPLENVVTVDPISGTIADEPVDLTLTIDARAMSPGVQGTRVVYHTNDPNMRSGYTTVRINVVAGEQSYGSIVQEVWTDIPGTKISAIPVNTPPAESHVLYSLEAPSNLQDNYGSRIRGYVIPPYSGQYIFFIASNDHSELWLSKDDDPMNSVKIASVTGYTNPNQWDKFPSQRSFPIHLEAYQKYYIEALHKEGVGTDHVSVGWELPGRTLERPIPGHRLVRFGEKSNIPPRITIVSPTEGQSFSSPATLEIKADAVDDDGNVAKVEFYNGSRKLGIDTSAPYSFTWKDVSPGNYTLFANATDNSGGTDSARVNVIVSEGRACTEAGHIVREQWNNVQGTLISSIPLHTPPSVTETLTTFESPRNIGDSYGTRIRGFLCVPQGGLYTFWISSNDKSELWLSSDSNPSNKTRIASVSRYTDPRQWTKNAEQQSVPIRLEAGQKYYIEALHKEGVGTDHLAVGWQLPDGTLERPIAGSRLLPFTDGGNQLPFVRVVSPVDGEGFPAEGTVVINAEAADADGSVAKVEFFDGTTKLGEDASAPYSFQWTNVPAGNHALTAVATDDRAGAGVSETVRINVWATCTASGSITRDFWTGIARNEVFYIPVDAPPDGTEELALFEGPQNAGTNYGARIHGYLCPPATGTYYFWISSNDHSELWLSSDDTPENKTRIAFVKGATGVREWEKFPSQKSVAIHLVQGRRYYIQALHKQGVGTDHVAVGWQLPDGSLERPIQGIRLSPANATASSLAAQSVRSEETPANGDAPEIQVYPNPVTGGQLTIAIMNDAVAEDIPRHIEIRQLTGLVVYRQTDLCAGDCTTNLKINEHLVPGVYILQIRVWGRVVTERLVVE